MLRIALYIFLKNKAEILNTLLWEQNGAYFGVDMDRLGLLVILARLYMGIGTCQLNGI